MAIIGSDNLSLLVGDGGGPEIFNILKGASVTRLEINQREHVTNAVVNDAWQTVAGASTRHATIECDAYANDEAAAIRLRSLVLSGNAGNFKIELSATETLVFSAIVGMYREVIAMGDIKRLQCRLESTGALTVV